MLAVKRNTNGASISTSSRLCRYRNSIEKKRFKDVLGGLNTGRDVCMDNLALTLDWEILSEKQRIELHTADKFLSHFNKKFGASFKITDIGDAPDITCQSGKETLFLEITLSQDLENDIPAFLGRSDSRSPEKVLKRTAYSLEHVTGNVIKAIKKKINKNYGMNVALIVRHVSGIDWDWEPCLDQIQASIGCANSPFDKGIWIVDDEKIQQIC